MKFSVVIPCHNAGPWIADALRSVAAQTYAPADIIVVDDASTDDSREQIVGCCVPVTLLSARVSNAAAARNIGIEAATGDWIALLDADDVWYPNRLQRAAELLSGSNDVALIGNHDFFDAKGAWYPGRLGFAAVSEHPPKTCPLSYLSNYSPSSSISVTRQWFIIVGALWNADCSTSSKCAGTTSTFGCGPCMATHGRTMRSRRRNIDWIPREAFRKTL